MKNQDAESINVDINAAILAKVKEISKVLGRDAHALKTSDVIPTSGVLDSAGLMELMIWYETEFGLSIPQEDFTLEKLGSVDQMAAYVTSYNTRR
jgi:D-alanine--poly(phosphoribitol) ligase subunit 2